MVSPDTKPSAPKHRKPRLYRIGLALVAALSVALLLLVGGALWVLENLDRYRDELALHLGQLLGQPVSIAGAQVSWRGHNPVLRVDELRIYNTDGSSTIGFDSAEVHVDFLNTFISGTLHAHGVHITGASVAITLSEDGQPRLLGIGANTTGDTQLAALKRLLSSPATLALSAAKLQYHPTPTSDHALELALAITSTPMADGRSIDGTLRLPGPAQADIMLSGSYTTGDTTADERLQLAIASAGVPLRELTLLSRDLPLPDADASLRFKLTAHMAGLEPPRLSGEVAIQGLRWTEQRFHGPTGISAQIGAVLAPDLVRITAQDVVVDGSTTTWTATRATALLRASGRHSVTFTEGRLEDLLAVLAFVHPDDDDVAEIRSYNAMGDMTELVLDWHDADITPIPYSVTARLRNVSWPKTSNYWGVKGLNGGLWMTHQHGTFEADAGPLILAAEDLSATPFMLDIAKGRIDFDIKESSIRYRTRRLELRNSDFGVIVAGTIISDQEPHELLDLRIEAADVHAQALQQHLPSPVLSAALNHWLMNNLKAGHIKQAHLNLQGRSNTLKIASHSDSLRLRLQFDGLSFSHSLPLPDITATSGTLRYQHGTVKAATTNMKLGPLQATATLNATDLGGADPSLTTAVELTGTAQSLINIIGDGSWDNVNVVAGLSAKGMVRAELKAHHYPVTEKLSIKGRLLLKDNQLNMPSNGLSLKQLSGEFIITDSIIRTDNLSFQLLGRPAKMTGNYTLTGPQHRGQFELSTRAPAQFWLDLAGMVSGEKLPTEQWLNNIQGQSEWSLKVNVNEDEIPQLTLQSSLIGTHLKLPAVFAKPPGSKAPFTANLELRPGAPLHLHYADVAKAVLLFPRDSEELSAISVGLGDSPPPTLKPGQWRIAGQLAALDLLELGSDSSLSTDVDLSRLELDLRIGRVMVGGVSFDNVNIAMGKTPLASGVLAIDSQSLAGFIRRPAKPGDTIVVDLEHLLLPEPGAVTESATFDPRSLPALSFNVKRLGYGGHKLGTLKFVSRRYTDGIELDKVYLLGDGFDAQGRVTWRRIGNGDLTTMAATVHADGLAALIHTVGHDRGATEGGATEITVNAAWNTAPAKASLSNMSGDIQFQSSNGRLLHVAPGAGARLFGLINLQSLPQLMILDIGSMFEEGLTFDRLHGHFSIDNGNAYTNNLTLESQTARIDVAGRIGLVAEDYDQHVKVTPSVSGSLPIAGAALGGVGAGVGAVIWLAEKVLDTKIVDAVAAFRYRITGPWSKPVIKRVLDTQSEAVSAGK